MDFRWSERRLNWALAESDFPLIDPRHPKFRELHERSQAERGLLHSCVSPVSNLGRPGPMLLHERRRAVLLKINNVVANTRRDQ